MALIKTIIDGTQIEVVRDRWALDVIRKMGISVPTLCHHPALEPYGACRLCVVEVTKGNQVWLTTACDLPIREGLNIRTDTENVKKARKTTIELLWARAPKSEKMASLAKEYGIEKPRFELRNDTGKCILCGLCVRVCDILIGASAIGFGERGKDRVVTTPFNGESDNCIGCNACVSVCPTGHILTVDKGNVRRMETWQTDLEMIECEDCGKAYMPVKLFEDIESKLNGRISLPKVCPQCIRSSTVCKLGKMVG